MSTTQIPPAPADQTTELMKQSTGKTVKDLLVSKEFQSQVAMALPRHMKAERFIRVALNATMRQPELLQCQRESLFLALLQLSAYGIEADGRRAHLIPFWDYSVCKCGHAKDQHRQGKCQTSKCGCSLYANRRMVQLILDYKGIAELVRRSGDVSYIHADVVLEGDDWDFQFGSEAFLRHKPNLELEAYPERRMVAAYSFVKLKDGSEDFIVISKADVEAVRSRSKSKDGGPWKSDYLEMAKKTVFRRHSKWLPLSPETRDAVEGDDEGDGFNAGVVLDGIAAVPDEAPPENEPPDTLADRVKAAAGHKEPAQEAAATSEPQPESTKGATVTEMPQGENLKTYTSDNLPDVMEVKTGYRCIFEGNILECVEPEGEAASWKNRGPAPNGKAATGRKRNADAFDGGVKQ